MRRRQDFFRSEEAYIEYTLIYGSGEQRTDLLGITTRHYADRALATRWAGELAGRISDEDAKRELRRIYRRMIGDEGAELPEKPEPVAEAMEDTIGYACRHGEEALERKLEQMTMEELKETIRINGLDPCKQFSRAKKPEKLREVIRVVTLARLHKGDGFI